MNTRLIGVRRRKASGGWLTRMLRIFLAVCLFVGVFCQITMLARISGQSKQISKVNGQIRELTATAENLEVCLSMYQNLDRIETLAYGLGMQFPEEAQIRVVSLPEGVDSAFTQTAENTAAETSMR